ncbi:GNAT family N-acetyltransferase [Virgibacillus pantothenticus]|uniref:GNAT family N-acetyltransferase n=1 Tax=Virgibacillus pantothenticus TaxID=1473 RepID=UPI003D2E6AEB
MKIRPYHSNYEKGWLQCRVLAFLETAYYDNVLREKETYDHKAIELVAIQQDKIVGLIDVEYESEKNTVCTGENGLGGMIWHLAVHPDYQRLGIGHQLLNRAERMASEKGINYLEAWTRDDEWVLNWYQKNGFHPVHSYLHVFLEGKSETSYLKSEVDNFYPVQAWAHYTGKDEQVIRQAFRRIHTCTGLEKRLNHAGNL